MLEELFIAVNLAAASASPVFLPDAITNKESHGEYLFYAAADAANGIDQYSAGKINAHKLKVSFVVDVSFESDTRRVALSEIADAKKRMATGARYDDLRDDIAMEGPGSFLDSFDSRVVILPIDSGENWASWIYGSMHQATGPASIAVWYQAVEGDRTLSINAFSVSDDYTLEELVEHWQSLVDRYRDIPMQVFTGAPVD